MKIKKLTPADEVALIEEKLGYVTFEREEESFEWLDLGDSEFNEALGHRKHGIRGGSIIELYGPESNGKTTVATIIASIAQRQDPKHTYVAKEDLEFSNNDEFNERMGIDLDRFYLFKSKIATSKKALKRLKTLQKKLDGLEKGSKQYEKAVEKYREASTRAEKFVENAQQVCKKVEEWIKYKRDQDPKARIILIVDSVTGLLVEEELDAGLTDQNMRTNVSLATFLSKLCRRWVSLADNYSVIMLMINQERTAPGVMFGNPTYTSGGKALKYYASVRARVTRVGNGKIKKNGRVVGIRMFVTNTKNKCGGAEGHKCGLKVYPRKGRWKVMDVDEIAKEAKREKNG